MGLLDAGPCNVSHWLCGGGSPSGHQACSFLNNSVSSPRRGPFPTSDLPYCGQRVVRTGRHRQSGFALLSPEQVGTAGAVSSPLNRIASRETLLLSCWPASHSDGHHPLPLPELLRFQKWGAVHPRESPALADHLSLWFGVGLSLPRGRQTRVAQPLSWAERRHPSVPSLPQSCVRTWRSELTEPLSQALESLWQDGPHPHCRVTRAGGTPSCGWDGVSSPLSLHRTGAGAVPRAQPGKSRRLPSLFVFTSVTCRRGHR